MEGRNVAAAAAVIIVAALVLIVFWTPRRKSHAEHQTDQQFQTLVDSSVQDIRGQHGTTAQKIRYPKWTDLVQYRTKSLPRWEIPKYAGILHKPAPKPTPMPTKKSLNPYCSIN